MGRAEATGAAVECESGGGRCACGVSVTLRGGGGRRAAAWDMRRSARAVPHTWAPAAQPSARHRAERQRYKIAGGHCGGALRSSRQTCCGPAGD